MFKARMETFKPPSFLHTPPPPSLLPHKKEGQQRCEKRVGLGWGHGWPAHMRGLLGPQRLAHVERSFKKEKGGGGAAGGG